MAEENKNIKGKINELAVYHTDAYKLAVENGYKGTLVEWLDSLVGKSAYEIAVMHGFKGTEKEWLDSLTEETAKKAEEMIAEQKQSALNEINAKKNEIVAAETTAMEKAATATTQATKAETEAAKAEASAIRAESIVEENSTAAAQAATAKADEVIAQRVAELGTIVQTPGDSPTAVMSQKAVTDKIEELDGRTSIYQSDFVQGMFELGTGVGASSSWIITPNATPIKKGDRIKFKPNGNFVLQILFESVDNLADITSHLTIKTLTAESEIVSDYDGFIFAMVRESAWATMRPNMYVCDVVIGKSHHEVLEEKIEAMAYKIEELDGCTRLYQSDFVQGTFELGTGIGTSSYWIITPNAIPIKKGDIIKIKPNGLACQLMFESVDNLADITSHLTIKSNITTDTEIVSDYDGFLFCMVRDSAGANITPEMYTCDITIEKTHNDEQKEDLEAMAIKNTLVVSPKYHGHTLIVNDCQDATKWTVTNENGLVAVDTENRIMWNQSLRCNKLMRCSHHDTYDLTKNYLVLKLRINQIDEGARLYLKIANTSSSSDIVAYELARGHSATPIGEWREFTIPIAGHCYSSDASKLARLDLTKIDDVFLDCYGTVDWNLQYVGVRPIRLKKPIITFTFDDGYKSQYTGLKLLAEKGITGTLFHIKAATENNASNQYLTIPELQQLVNYYNADIEAHGDPTYDEWDEADLVEHWRDTQEWFKANGLGDGKYMAYPGGKHPANVVQLAKAYFTSCRTISGYIPFETYPPADNYRVRALTGVGAGGVNVDTVKAYIDRAVAYNAWLILVFHKIGDGGTDSMWCTESDLQAIADYAIESGADIMNYAEVFESGVLN